MTRVFNEGHKKGKIQDQPAAKYDRNAIGFETLNRPSDSESVSYFLPHVREVEKETANESDQQMGHERDAK